MAYPGRAWGNLHWIAVPCVPLGVRFGTMGGLRVTSDCFGYPREAYGTIVLVKHPERVPGSQGFGWGTA